MQYPYVFSHIEYEAKVKYQADSMKIKYCLLHENYYTVEVIYSFLTHTHTQSTTACMHYECIQ